MAKRQKSAFPLFTLVLCSLLLSCILYRNQDTPAEEPTFPNHFSEEPYIKVLLRKASNKEFLPLKIIGDYHLEGLAQEAIYQGKDLEDTQIVVSDNAFQFGAFRIEKTWIKVVPAIGSFLKLNGKLYQGNLILSILGGRIQSVLELPLDTYLLGVVGSEMSNKWAAACLEAQTIASRTYALYQIQKGGTRKNYHVEDTISSQVFKGLESENDLVRAAIENTRGQVLTYAGKVVPAYFHSTCGGHTSAAVGILEHKPLLPLSGATCKYCQISKYYKWEALIPEAEVLVALESLSVLPSNSIVAIFASEKDLSGRSKTIRVTFDNGVLKTYKSTDFRRVIGYSKLRSVKFNVTIQKEGIFFQGGGFGHGVGMCQMGAKGMADQGFNSKDIVTHYYSGASLERFW